MTLNLHEPLGATQVSPVALLGLKFKHIANRCQLDELKGDGIIEKLTCWNRRRDPSTH